MIKNRRAGVSAVTIFLLTCVIVMMTMYIIYSAESDAKRDRCARDYRLYSVAASLAGISDAYEKSAGGMTDEIVRIYSNADNIIRQLTECDMESATREFIVSDMNLIKSACVNSLADGGVTDVFASIPESAERVHFFNEVISTTAAAIYARLVESYDCDCINPDKNAAEMSREKMAGTAPLHKCDCEKSAEYFTGAALPMKCAKAALSRPGYVFYCENAFVTVDMSGGIVRQYYYEGARTSRCIGDCGKSAIETVRAMIPVTSGVGGSLEVKSATCDGGRCTIIISQNGAPSKYATVEMCCETKRVYYFDIGTLCD